MTSRSFRTLILFVAMLMGLIPVMVGLTADHLAMAEKAEVTHRIDPDVPIYWQHLSNYMTYDFAIDPINSANIYIATGYPEAVAFSRDFGATWISKTVTKDIFFPSGRSIAVDPLNPNYIYLSTTSGGIFRSSDSGYNWDRIDQGMAGTTTISPMFVHPVTPTIIMAGTYSGLPIIYRSDNRGDTWQEIPLVDEPTNRRVLQILSHPTIPNRIFAVVWQEGIFVSEDAGLTWTFDDMLATAIAFDQQTPEIMYRVDCYPYRSNDGGITWSQLPSPQPCYDQIHVDPQDGDVVYLTSQYRRVTRSLDGGQNWQILQGVSQSGPYSSSFAIDPIDSTRLYVGPGVYVSIYLDNIAFLPLVLH